MPEKILLEILKTIIPLQEVNVLLKKIAKSAMEVSSSDLCVIMKYNFEEKKWVNIASYPEGDFKNPFEGLSIEPINFEKPIFYNPKEKIPQFISSENPFCTFPLFLPSLQIFFGIMYLERFSKKIPYYEKKETEIKSFANLASLCLENDLLFEKANIDELTKAYTKGFFLTRLEEEFQRAIRTKSSFGIFLCDVDDFKNINDKYGHLKGDYVLKKFVETVKKNLRIYDVIGRFGGDEFIILLPGLESTNLYNVAKKMQENLSKVEFDLPEPVTFSFGAVSFPFHKAENIQDLIIQADLALYQAKQQGKGRIIISGRETPILSPLSSQVSKYLTAKVEVKEFFQVKDLIYQIIGFASDLPFEKKEAIIQKVNTLKKFLEENFNA